MQVLSPVIQTTDKRLLHCHCWLNLWQITSMGFADLSMAEIAAGFESVEEVLGFSDRLLIAHKTPNTQLALENAKAILSAIMAQKQRVDIDRQVDIPTDTTATGNCEESISQ
jgi:hypothetical protein